MIQDFRPPPDGSGPEADVCVIGSGAAGITVARRLAASKLRTVVVESGGLDFDPEIQSLTAASVAGLPMRAFDRERLETVHAGRFRMLGGTTYAWAGICTELDESDFELREWVPYSGWPLAKTDLDPWYQQARREIGVDPELLGDRALIKLGVQTPRGLDLLRVQAWQFCAPPLRFGFVHRAELAAARNTLVLLHATATKLHANAARTAVERVEVRAREGRSAFLRARAFVLACGGIENARLLLASTDGRSPGLGNDRDLVGRFFMDHLRCHLGVLTVRDGALVEDVWRGGSDTSRLGFSLAPSAQHHHQVAHAAAYLWYPPLPEDWPRAMELEAAGDVATPEALTLDVLVDAEQVPNPDSRVTLEEELDQVGVPRARVEWRLADLDRRTLSAAASVLGAEFDRLGLGRLRSDRWITGPDRDWALYVHDVFHHAGTTRMARDPSAGVTDSDCRVHGIANLYVAGSSVFPTSGHANPTLTIVALALRLADWLAGVLA